MAPRVDLSGCGPLHLHHLDSSISKLGGLSNPKILGDRKDVSNFSTPQKIEQTAGRSAFVSRKFEFSPVLEEIIILIV